MCGIAGALAPHGFDDPGGVATRLQAMAAAVAHRGPDGRGVWHDREAGLAATRLAIVDLSRAGQQPMLDEAVGTAIAYNGEAYNFRDLRRELEARGHAFRSGTDTEVVLAGYGEWGDGVVTRLRGMFAFAIWDAPRRRLLLARDRVGQKPLYYAWLDGTLLFGSEIKALLAWPGMPRRPHLPALHHYLSFRYVPGVETAFAGVTRLPPAHTLVVEAGRAGAPRRYWSRPAPGPPSGAGGRPAAGAIRDLFDESVRLRMAADVPVGAFLSGGIDSSSVVAAMAGVATEPVRTFTIGFDDASIDEREGARLVAERYGTQHVELAGDVDVTEVLPQIVWHYGEPYADPVAIPTYLLAAAARRHCKVVLTGDGGDEAFLGYRRHAAARLAAWLDVAPPAARRGAARAAARWAPAGYLRRFAGQLDQPPAVRHAAWTTYIADDVKAELYDGRMRQYLAATAADVVGSAFADDADPAVQAANADLDWFLPDDLLVRLDVATMAHGLEGRSPFLDHKLLELVLALPAGVRLRGLRTKALLRSVMADRLPAALRRRPKLGFPMPLGLRRPAAEQLVRDALADKSVRERGLFDPAAVRRLVERHFAGHAELENELWELTMLELWHRAWIDPPAPPIRPARP